MNKPERPDIIDLATILKTIGIKDNEKQNGSTRS